MKFWLTAEHYCYSTEQVAPPCKRGGGNVYYYGSRARGNHQTKIPAVNRAGTCSTGFRHPQLCSFNKNGQSPNNYGMEPRDQ